MHQIVLLTAMTATSGLFGGGRACKSGHCGSYAAAPAAYAPAAPCASGRCGSGYSYAPYAQPMTYGYAPTHAYAPAPAYSYAPTPQVAAAPTGYTSYYYPPASSCATGNCPRR